jgi:hypothetical protein
MMINLPVNVKNVFDSFRSIVNLEFIDKQMLY